MAEATTMTEGGSANAATANAGDALEIESLRREVERLRVTASPTTGLLDAILEHSPHGIIVSDANGKLVLQNRAAEKIWAGSASVNDVEGWSRYRGFHPDGRAYRASDWGMAACLATGKVVEPREIRIQRFDGTYGMLLGSAAPLRSADGSIEGAVSMFADITPLKETYETLAPRESHHRQILDSIHEMVFCKDEHLRVVYANRSTCDYYGRTLEELRGLSDVPHNRSDFTEQYLRDDARVFETGETVEVLEEPNLSRSGEVRYFHTIKTPLRDDTGKIVQLVGVSRDVTERRRMERRVAAHHEIARILSDATDPTAAVRMALEALVPALEWDFGAVYNVAADALRCEAAWTPSEDLAVFANATLDLTFAYGHGLPGRVWSTGKPAWVADASSDESFVRGRAAVDVGLRAAFAFPVVADGSIVAVVELFRRTPQPRDAALLEITSTIGSQLGQFIRRWHAQEAVRVSEALKTSILASALDGVVTIDERGAILEFNSAAEAMLGHRRDAVVGRELVEILIPPELRDAARATLAGHPITGDNPILNRRLEFEAMRSDGSRLPVELSITATELGRRRLFTTFISDITQRKRENARKDFMVKAAELLNANLDVRRVFEDLARLAVPAIGDWCAIDVAVSQDRIERVVTQHFDPTRVALAAELERRYPSSPDAPHGVPKVLRTGEREWVRQLPEGMLEALAQDEEHLHILRSLALKSFVVVPLQSRGRILGALTVVYAESGRLYGEEDLAFLDDLARRAALAVDNALLFEDATRKAAALEDERRALERINKELDQFAYVTSHDLKAPLRGIANLSEWIEEDLGPALHGEPKKQMALLRGRVHRMEALIDGILAYSRVGRSAGKLERVDVGVLLRELTEMLSPVPPARIEARAELPTIWTERVPFQQVLLNLLANALKHSKRADAYVTLVAAREGPLHHFVVRDNGPGIAPEFHERIWNIFQTLEARDAVESTGVGLSIVRKIVEGHGGRAWVESTGESGDGAAFHFTWAAGPATESTT